jgi:hypothetical protein
VGRRPAKHDSFNNETLTVSLSAGKRLYECRVALGI